MLDHAIARAIVLVAIVGLVWIGLAFAAFAVAMGLAPYVGLAGAAACTAALCLVGPLIWLLVKALARPALAAPPVPVRHAPIETQQAVLTALSAMAKEKPLLAVIGAGLFGAADILQKERSI